MPSPPIPLSADHEPPGPRGGRWAARLVLVPLLPWLAGGTAAQPPPSRADAAADAAAHAAMAMLRSAGIPPTGAGALAFLRGDADPIAAVRIAALVDELGAPRFAVRAAAERELQAHGTAALGALQQALGAGCPEVRERARRLLARLEHHRHDELLAAALRVVAAQRPRGAADGLLAAAPRLDTERLQPLLAETLAAVLRPADEPLLTSAIADPRPPVRRAAVGALALLPGLHPHLPAALYDTDPGVRLAAARALAAAGERRALPVLVDLLAGALPHRVAALDVLAQVTRRPSSFVPWADEQQRARAVREWRAWLWAEGRTAPLFPLGQHPRFRPVRAFVLSATDQGAVVCDRSGGIAWRLACRPYDVFPCGDDAVLVTERNAGVVRIVDRAGRTLRLVERLASPTDADLLPDGNLLIVLNGAGRVVEIDPAGRCVWSADGLNNPFDAERLDDGTTIVADSGNNRLVVFDQRGRIVEEIGGLAFPNGVLRLPDGSTVCTTYTSGSVVLLDRDGRVRWERKVEGATLYSPAMASGHLYVADGKGSRIVVFDLEGREVERIALPLPFNDVGYLR